MLVESAPSPRLTCEGAGPTPANCESEADAKAALAARALIRSAWARSPNPEPRFYFFAAHPLGEHSAILHDSLWPLAGSLCFVLFARSETVHFVSTPTMD